VNLLALALAAAVVSPASPAHNPSPSVEWTSTAPAPTQPVGTHFKCQEGGDLVARFDTRGERLVAIVDAGDGAHALPIRAWNGGPAMMTWSDGQRTLTWSPGVQIMWMDGAAHRMCGGGHHHDH
jgi:hypothetical protein